jgi:DNA-binding transcriptional regulator YhcF (GntR family)
MPAQQYSAETNPFAVRPESDVPVGVQLNWRLRTLILTGRLRSNETLPSVRRLANWAGVNANTVRGVYDALQEEGLITSRQGKGTFVAEGAQPKLGLESMVLDTVRRGQESGADPRDLAIAFMACADMLDMEGGTAAPPASQAGDERGETIEIRRELRRQIAQLESELASYVRDLPAGELPTAPAWAEGHVAGVEELEQTRDVLVAKLFKARESAEQRARREGEARAEHREPPAPGPLARAMSWWGEAMEQRSSR